MNRKVILNIAMSLDGFIATEDDGVEWLVGNNEKDESNPQYEQFCETIDTVIIGRRTYDQITTTLSPDQWPYKNMNAYIVSKQKTCHYATQETAILDVDELVSFLKEQNGKHIWILGGAQIANALIKADLIDEYQISVIPIVIGRGIRLFNADNPTTQLHLDNCTIHNGIIMAIYSKRVKVKD